MRPSTIGHIYYTPMIVDFFQIPIPTIKSNTLETGKGPPSEAGAGGWEVEEVEQELT